MRSDVLVIGSGGAGLVAAINAHESGAKVIVVTKDYATRAQTCMAQGGINAALSNVSEDSIEAHIENTLKSAHGIANEEAVRLLCSKAPEAIEWLDSIGVPFSRTVDAKIAQRALGGASAPRACYAQDYTGLKILHTLYDRCLALGIEIVNDMYLLECITESDENSNSYVCGATFLNKRSGTIEVYEAKSVVIATGGYSRVYEKNSTNAVGSSGDGIAAALRAGARVSDMEFVQFHPTGMKNSAILISESARGAGGYLLNSKGERFTKELAPRDVVARAINDEIEKGEDVFLDIRHLGEKFIDEELPQERKLARLYENVDPVHELIPIKPVAHYTMGGIEVDANSKTTIDGLYAAGECANHRVHGANRLGGNSLLELIVFGKQAGENAAKYAKTREVHIDKEHSQKSAEILIDTVKNYTNEMNFYKQREYLGDMFYKDVGIKRDKATLERVLKEVRESLNNLPLMGVSDKSEIYNTNLIEFLEFRNILSISELVLMGAVAREESRGAHYRIDKPDENDELFRAHTVIDREGVLCYED